MAQNPVQLPSPGFFGFCGVTISKPVRSSLCFSARLIDRFQLRFDLSAQVEGIEARFLGTEQPLLRCVDEGGVQDPLQRCLRAFVVPHRFVLHPFFAFQLHGRQEVVQELVERSNA